VGYLRKSMIEQVGTQTAQTILARFGYESAVHDYQLLDQVFPTIDSRSKLDIGPIMHGWCGLVKVVPEYLHTNRQSDEFIFRGRWINSYEAISHLQSFGKSSKPVCFSLTGYGSAWCSQFFGIDLLEIERKCIACGDPYCEWEIRPWDNWGPEADPWKKSLKETDRKIIVELFSQQQEINAIKSRMDKIISEKVAQNTFNMKALCHDLDASLQLAISNLNESLASGETLPTHHAAWSVHQAKKVVDRFYMAQVDHNNEIILSKTATLIFPLFEETLRLVKDRADKKMINIELNIKPEIFSYTDPIILRDHVLVNILTNAIKFSPLRSVISISAHQINPGRVLLEVSDRGVGIPEFILETLTRESQIPSRPGTAKEKGSGQGLYLANFFTKILGGNLQIHSISSDVDPINSGTVVSVEI
jgi:hypothetical protein